MSAFGRWARCGAGRWRTAAVLLALLPATPGCFWALKEDQQRTQDDVRALQAEFESIRTNMNASREQLREQIAQSDAKVKETEKAFREIEKFTNSRSAEFFVQIERAIGDLQALRGRLEDQEHQVAALQASLEALRADVYGTKLESGKSGGAGSAGAASTPPAGGDGAGATGPVGTTGAAPAAGSDDPKAAYDTAFKTLEGGRPEEARKLFQDFVRKWPDHALADNAQYWLGESYFTQEKYQNAILAFREVVEKFPKGDKQPDALLKLGMSFAALELCDEARLFYRTLIDEHSKSPLVKTAQSRMRELDTKCKKKK